MKSFVTIGLLTLLQVSSLAAGDDRLIGTWSTEVYSIEGVDHPMHGLMIFTPGYFTANVTFDLTGSGAKDANANSGPYFAQNGRIIFSQWMQLHLRAEAPEETFLTEGIDEEASYRFEGENRLIIQFPSGNFYRLERLGDTQAIAGLEGLWSYQTIQSQGLGKVPLSGLFLFHNGRFLQQSINDAGPFEDQLGQGHSGTYQVTDEGLELFAEKGIIVNPAAQPVLSSRNGTFHQVVADRQGDELTLTFGTGTVQKFQRIPLGGPIRIYRLQDDGALAISDDKLILVAQGPGYAVAGGGRVVRAGNQLRVHADRWLTLSEGRRTYLKEKAILLSFDGKNLELPDGQALKVKD